MTEDSKGFEVHLGNLEIAATQYLPEVAMALQRIVHVIPESARGKSTFPAMITMTDALDNYIATVARRQGKGIARIDETADALLDVVRLYRRADGQR